jgi:putative peptide zinc metalloprotease protein
MKTLHELGHAFVVKKFGGEVHTMGLMFLVFMPLPYVDATASWGFRSRYARALVGAAGIIVELFLAALGAMVWAATGPGLINSLAFNVMVIGSVSSLLFNGNPLLRFDAYYVLSDLLDIPNLYQKASQQWFYFADRYLLGSEKAESPARDRREWWHMTLYGLFSFFYRMLIVATILLFVTDQWFAVGVVFAFTTLIMLVVLPAKKWWTHLTGGAVYRNRRRAVLASLALVLVPSAVVLWLPLPNAIRVPGMVEALQYTRITASSSGRLDAVVVPSGTPVTPGQLLLVLASPELDWELDVARQQTLETQMLLSMALGNTLSDIVPLQQRLESLAARTAELSARREALEVRARHTGVWFSPQLNEKTGNWLPRGELLGEVVDNSRLRFTAVVSQEEANRLFRDQPQAGELRLIGQADHTVEARQLAVLPYQKQQLASSALGWSGGGSIPVRPDDPQGLSTVDSFYEVQAPIPADQPIVAWHGMTGWLRIPMQYQSLYEQLATALMQLLQKRYQL